MYRPADVDNSADFNQYYRHSYIGIRDQNNPNLYHPAYVMGAGDRDTFTLNIQTGPIQMPFADILQSAQFGTPQYGSTEVGETCVYVSRRAVRNAGRGHRVNTLSYTFFHPQEADGERLLTSWEYLSKVFNPSYRTIQEAHGLLEDGARLACAVGAQFTMTLQEGYRCPVLHYKTNIIGYLPTHREIVLEERQEHEYLVRASFPELVIQV